MANQELTSFSIQANRLNSTTPQHPTPAAAKNGNFAAELAKAQEVRFSNHAQKRLEKRQIALTDDGLNRLAAAVEKAEEKGGRESLVVMDNIAFIVNVKDRLVVTAIDDQNSREGVFTQIDSVVFARPAYEQA